MILAPEKPIQDILFPYQKEDVQRLLDIPRGLIASEMGTGKTEVFLALCDLLQPSRVLIAAPKSMVLEWKDRIALRLGEEAAVPYGTEEGKYYHYSLDKEHFNKRFLIVNHEMLRMERYLNVLKIIPWDIFSIDEAHRFKSRKAKQTKGAIFLARKSERMYHITGTPFLNYPDELWQLLDMLQPHQWGMYEMFTRLYCVKIDVPGVITLKDGRKKTVMFKKIAGANKRNLPQLRKRLEPIMIRREKKDVLKDLPRKLDPRDIPVPMEKEQAALYAQMEEDFVIELKNGALLSQPEVLGRLMRLRQLSLDPELLEGITSPSAKTKALEDILEDIDDQVVIFSFFASYLRKIRKQFPNSSVIEGNQDAQERQNSIKEFREGKTKIMFTSILAGGVGINLNTASTAIFTDVFWTPGINTQAEDRLHRIGQENEVTIIRLVSPETIDEDMHKVLKRKQLAFDETIAVQESVRLMMGRH